MSLPLHLYALQYLLLILHSCLQLSFRWAQHANGSLKAYA